MKNIYERAKQFKDKYPRTISIRLEKHASVVERYLKPNEIVQYVFCANAERFPFISSRVIAITNKRILIGRKGLIYGHSINSIDLNKFNDLKVKKHLIWSGVEIDTLKECVSLNHIDPNGAIQVEDAITTIVTNNNKKMHNDKQETYKQTEKPKSKDRQIFRTETSDLIIDNIKSRMNYLRRNDKILRERLNLSRSSEERIVLKNMIISNYNEYIELSEQLKSLSSEESIMNNNILKLGKKS